MKIGLDMSVIQTAHRMRGIGATAINFMAGLSDDAKKDHTFILYMYEAGQAEALAILDLTNLRYEVKTLQPQTPVNFRLPGRLRILNSVFNYLRGIYISRSGDSRHSDLGDIDYYLQFDQAQTLPKRSGLTTAVILYDLIPYVMESDYLWSYRTSREHGLSRKASFRKALVRKRYLDQASSVARSADRLFAISEHTKKDFVRYAKIDPKRIDVIHLGASKRNNAEHAVSPSFSRYEKNSWGYFPRKFNIKDKPFLLFIGGVDPRRRLADLGAAFNNLRAQGVEIRLVLAGDTMKSPEAIPSAKAQHDISSSSYLDDMVFLGFVTDEQRDWLYEHATAMVYPSVYEGFGLPVLEAMQYGTPVITYSNTSIHEIADDAALYATNAASIQHQVEKLLSEPALREHYATLGHKQAGLFSWSQTTEKMLKALRR